MIIPIQTITLRQNAWFGDNQIVLDFPAGWKVSLIGDQPIPALTSPEILSKIQQPIQSSSLEDLAKGKRSALILVDDLSRPTPIDQLLPHILSELRKGGLDPQAVTLLVCGGTHPPISTAEMARKLGNMDIKSIRWAAHDSHANLVDLGQTPAGIPVQIDHLVMKSDLKIGLGCIYPHPAAGFSGGAKILAPGAAGYHTIRALHDQTRTARQRGGGIRTEFRQQIQSIAEMVGLDFVVNVTLNQDRAICGVYAGQHQAAFEKGAADARRLYAVNPLPAADIVITDLYPFDIDFQIAMDRGFWPFDFCSQHASRVVLASCPMGMGGHELFPVTHSFTTRLVRRLKNFRLADLLTLPDRLRAMRRMLIKKQLRAYVLSKHLIENDLHNALPRTIVHNHWKEVMDRLTHDHPSNQPISVAIYRCAPLMIATGGPTE
jgi:hypothetical protein